MRKRRLFVFCPVRRVMSLAVHSLLQYTNKHLLIKVYPDQGTVSNGPDSEDLNDYEAFLTDPV